MNKKTIYTVLIGNYDTISEAPKFDGWDSILFTDQELGDYKGWEVRRVDSDPELSDKKLSRKYKILSHQYLHDYDLVCYIDANMQLLKEPPSEPTFFSHPSRRTTRQEISSILRQGKDIRSVLQKQWNAYKRAGFKDNVGLYANGFFVRDNSAVDLFECWWSQIYEYSHRDQVSLPYAIWITGDKVNSKSYQVAQKYIKLHPHQPHEINVHHITPGRSDKNYGKSINDIIKLLPDQDWICLRDIDTIPMHHEKFFKQCEEIARSGKFGLVGCMTNRLGLKWQLHEGKVSENMDMEKHREIAIELSNKFGSEVATCRKNIAGLFMLFSKKTWMKVGGFPEGKIMIKGSFIDFHFSEAARKHGIKTGIAKGIYLFHAYRMGKNIKDINHLL